MLTPPSCRSPHSHGHPLCAPLIACPRFHALSPLRTNGGTVHLPSPFRLGYATPAPSLRTPPRPHALPLCAHAGGCRRDSAHPQPSPHGLRPPPPPASVPPPPPTPPPPSPLPPPPPQACRGCRRDSAPTPSPLHTGYTNPIPRLTRPALPSHPPPLPTHPQ